MTSITFESIIFHRTSIRDISTYELMSAPVSPVSHLFKQQSLNTAFQCDAMAEHIFPIYITKESWLKIEISSRWHRLNREKKKKVAQ